MKIIGTVSEQTGNSTIRLSLLYDGILRTMEVYEKLMLSTNNYNHPDSKTATFTNMQIHFLDGRYRNDDQRRLDGKRIVEKRRVYERRNCGHCFHAHADYQLDRGKNGFIYARHENVLRVDRAGNRRRTKAKLTAIIDAVDNGTGKPSDVSQKDYDKIVEARSITPTMACYHKRGHSVRVGEYRRSKEIFEIHVFRQRAESIFRQRICLRAARSIYQRASRRNCG